jgi:predicted N-acyltransferase
MPSVRVFESIGQIEPARWDGIDTDPFSTHAVLRTLESAGLTGVKMCFAVLDDGRKTPALCIPYARIDIDAARLTHGVFHRLIQGVRVIRSSFLNTSIMICGIPLSVGNRPLRIRRDFHHGRAYGLAASLLQELAQEDGTSWCVFKEIAPRDLDVAHSVLKKQWTLAPSEPGWALPIRWTSYEDYVGSLRSAYRYKLRKSTRKLLRNRVTVDVSTLEDGFSPGMHSLYEAVVDRADVRLERLTAPFFEMLGRECGESAQMIRFSRDGRTIGWVALLVDGDQAYDMFHGIDYTENPETDLYFNQLAEAVRFAIQRRVSYLHLGQSTATAKTRFGAVRQPLWTAVHHRHSAVNAVLRSGRGILFREESSISRRVFND